MKVLVAVDGSRGSSEAVRQAAQLLAPGKDELALYYSPPTVEVKAREIDAAVLERVRLALDQGVFDQAHAQLPAALHPSVHTIVGTQPAKQGILVAADQWHADLIAIGARGLGPLERLLLGSVSRAVSHGAHAPVLVARERTGRREGEPLRVMAACDSAAQGQPIAELLSRLTWPADAVGQTITVVPSLLVGQVPAWLEKQVRTSDVKAMAHAWQLEHQTDLQAKRDQMRAFCKQLPGPFQQTEPLVVEGHPAEKILERAAADRVDVIVLVARETGTIARLLLGSTSEAVLNHAPCSVLIVHAPPTP